MALPHPRQVPEMVVAGSGMTDGCGLGRRRISGLIERSSEQRTASDSTDATVRVCGASLRAPVEEVSRLHPRPVCEVREGAMPWPVKCYPSPMPPRQWPWLAGDGFAA